MYSSLFYCRVDLQRRELEGDTFTGDGMVSPADEEFLCPVCRRLGNTLLPVPQQLPASFSQADSSPGSTPVPQQLPASSSRADSAPGSTAVHPGLPSEPPEVQLPAGKSSAAVPAADSAAAPVSGHDAWSSLAEQGKDANMTSNPAVGTHEGGLADPTAAVGSADLVPEAAAAIQALQLDTGPQLHGRPLAAYTLKLDSNMWMHASLTP